MKERDKLAILKDLKRRCSKSQRGLLALFRGTGVQLSNDRQVTLIDLKRLQEQDPDKFKETLEYLYPERRKQANAFDWMSLVGGVLSGAGGALSGNSTYDKQTESALLIEQQDAARYEREKSEKMTKLYIIAGIIVAVLIAIVIIYKRRG